MQIRSAKLFLIQALLAIGMIVFGMSYAQQPSVLQNPVTELQGIINQTQKAVEQSKQNLTTNTGGLVALVQKNLLPYMSVNHMAAIALGPKWNSATPEQKSEFITQFTYMLTRAYAAALLKADQYQIVIFPLRTNRWQTANQLALSGTVTSEGGQSSAVTYYVERSGTQWLVYDFAVEGVSVMQNFQSQLQSFSTMDQVIARVKEVNASS